MSQKRIPTSRERRMLELAAKTAATSSFRNFKHGAVLAKGSSVLNISTNKNQYSSFAARFKECPSHATVHAELGAILGVDRDSTSSSHVYVVRVNKIGDWKLSKPCQMCQAAMEYVGIKKVIYSVGKDEVGEIRF